MKKIVFTDLDGTLLNHDDYSYFDAKPAIETILKQGIPLVFTTSKTKIEVEELQSRMGVNEPFIVENGAALFIPKNYNDFDFSFLEEFEDYHILKLGEDYKTVLKFYEDVKNRYNIFGFSDMSIMKVIELTGLTKQAAELSIQRNFTEPFVVDDDTCMEELSALAIENNLKITKGGRFYHLIGAMQDKGIAIARCIAIFEKIYNENIKSIGLGDGQNDVALLNSVTVPIAIQNHVGEYIEVANPKLQKSTYKGAKGWNEMILKNV